MRKIAICLSGQGAQYPGMGKEIFDISAASRDVFQKADIIKFDTSALCFNGTKEELAQTINTQPCLFAVDLAIARALIEAGIVPSAIAGFSVGEIPALALAGVMTDEDAMRVVSARGKYMEECGEQSRGAMAAIIGLDANIVEEICLGYEEVWPVNYNSPAQTVVAGKPESIDLICENISKHGGRAIKLNVSGAFHTPYMAEASTKLRDFLKEVDFRDPDVEVYSNKTASPYEGDYKELLSEQLVSSVLWKQTIENMANDMGIEIFIEAGPGKALSGMIKKILPDAVVFNCENAEDLEKIKNALC
jgi:(acyl-carrier-protein) S-malonyltransferase